MSVRSGVTAVLSDTERAGHLAYSRLPVFRRRVESSLVKIEEFVWSCSPYVACSGGKDSSVLLHLALRVAMEIDEYPVTARILTSGESRLLHRNLDEVLGWWRREYAGWLDLEEVRIDRIFDPLWADASWSETRAAGRGDILEYLPDHKRFNGVLMGLRDQESNARRIANKKAAGVYQYSPDRNDDLAGTFRCCPLAHWKTEDIAAYIVSHDLPALEAYDAGFDTRTTMRLTGTAARQNAFQSLRLRDPDSYNRLLERFPELAWWNG